MKRPSANTALASAVCALVFGLVASSAYAQEGNIWGPISEAITWSENGYRDFIKDGKSQREYFTPAERYSMAQDATNFIERMRETHPAVAEQGRGRYKQDMERLQRTTDKMGKKLDTLGIPRPQPTPATPQPRPAQPAPPPRGPSFESFNREVNPLPPNRGATTPAPVPARTETPPQEPGRRDSNTPPAGDSRPQNTSSQAARGTIDTRSSQDSKGGSGGTIDTRSSQGSKGGAGNTADIRSSQDSKGGSGSTADIRSSQDSKGGAGNTSDTRSSQDSKGGVGNSSGTRSVDGEKITVGQPFSGSGQGRSPESGTRVIDGEKITVGQPYSGSGQGRSPESGTRSVDPNKGPAVAQPGAKGQEGAARGSTQEDFLNRTQENKGRPSGMTPEGLGMKSDSNATLGGKDGVKLSDLRGGANQGATPGGPAVAEGAATRGEYKPPSASSSAAEGERLGRAVSNATAPTRENLQKGLSNLNDTSTISKIGNTLMDAADGKITGTEAAQTIAATAIDYVTTPPVPGLPGAATSAITLNKKSQDLARGLNAVEAEQTSYDRERAIDVGTKLQEAGVSAKDRINIMYEVARGNDDPLKNKQAELEQKGIQLELPERQIARVESDDTVTERAGNALYGLGKGIVYDAPKEVLTQAWRTGDKLGTIVREGSDAVESQNAADAQRDDQNARNEKMASRFENLGFNADDVAAAFDSRNGGSPYAWESLQAKAAILDACPDLMKLSPEERQAALDSLLAQMISDRPDVDQETVVKEIAKTLGPPEEKKPPMVEPPLPPENPPGAGEGEGGTDKDFVGTDTGVQGTTDGQTSSSGDGSQPGTGLDTTPFTRTQKDEQERDSVPPVAPDSEEARRLLAVLAHRQTVFEQAEADRRAWLESQRATQVQDASDYQRMLDDYKDKVSKITDYEQRRALYNQQVAAWNDYQRRLKDYKGQVEAWNDYRRRLADYNNRVARYNDYRQQLLDYNNRVAAWRDYQQRLAAYQQDQQRQWEDSQRSPPYYQQPYSGGSGGGQKNTAIISDAPQ